MNEENKKRLLSTRQVAGTAALLAICIISQFMKSLSVYITGPIINSCLVLTALLFGLPAGILLSFVTPVTAFLIAPSPVMQAIPGIVVLIMLGNMILAVGVHFLVKSPFMKKNYLSFHSVAGAIVSALLKAGFMGVTIALWAIPTYLPETSKLRDKIAIFQYTFSFVQFFTAMIGLAYVFLLWPVLRKALASKSD